LSAPSKGRQALNEIPLGHYHRVMEEGHAIRRAWHLLKFRRVLEALPEGPGGSLIDIGCFAGSLLSLAPEAQFSRQLGVDVLPSQIEFANAHFGNAHRRFQHIASMKELRDLPDVFECATCVEVIEHLRPDEIRDLFLGAAKLLEPGSGKFVLSTPNYTSAWPLLELVLQHFSDVDYSEQHITRLNWFNLRSKLTRIVPELNRYFAFELVTTTHLLSPFVAGLFGVRAAIRLGSFVTPSQWRIPIGNLILVRLGRTGERFKD
jgi:2-polyprenyl-3-methyl-5-hydroxy-6-metoxy-1,4-benzoquinol methylase